MNALNNRKYRIANLHLITAVLCGMYEKWIRYQWGQYKIPKFFANIVGMNILQVSISLPVHANAI
jgi:hypothetical protein